MAETSVSHLIWFIVSVAVAGSAGIGLTVYVQSISEGLEERADTLAGTLGTDIAVINDPACVPYNQTSGEMVIYIKNTGSTELNVDSIIVLIDGAHYETLPADRSIVTDGYERWSRGVVLAVNVTVPGLDTARDHRVYIDASAVDSSAHAEAMTVFRAVVV